MRRPGREGIYDGLVSSHFFFRLRQVMQPVLERPLVILSWPPGIGRGCLRGRPRFRGTLTGVAVTSEFALAIGSTPKGFILCNSSASSNSSILGVTSSMETSDS